MLVLLPFINLKKFLIWLFAYFVRLLKNKITSGVFHECQVQDFFEISELKFTSVNEHFKFSKVTKKLTLVKNALISYPFLNVLIYFFSIFFIEPKS